MGSWNIISTSFSRCCDWRPQAGHCLSWKPAQAKGAEQKRKKKAKMEFFTAAVFFSSMSFRFLRLTCPMLLNHKNGSIKNYYAITNFIYCNLMCIIAPHSFPLTVQITSSFLHQMCMKPCVRSSPSPLPGHTTAQWRIVTTQTQREPWELLLLVRYSLTSRPT